MKKVWPAWLFLFLGAFFLTTAGVAQFWAKDAAERTPLDADQVTRLSGNADLLDPATGKTNPTPVKIVNDTKIDDGLSDGKVIVFVTSTCVVKDVGDPPDCPVAKGKDADPRVISETQLNFAADRHTAEALDSDKYVTNTPPVEGLVNKWPFHPKQQTYQVWDDTSKQATDATFSGTTTVNGLECYTYHQVITDAPIDLGSNIDGLYSLDETYTIDQVTGKIINQQVHDVRTVKDGGDTALDLTAQYTDDTIKDNTDFAKSAGKQLTLVTQVLPIAGLVAGLLCLAVGVLLLMRRRKSDTEAPAPEPQHAAT
jgi:DUF3068 family protein